MEDRIEGNGVFIWANGARYEGEWMNNKREGEGIWKSSIG